MPAGLLSLPTDYRLECMGLLLAARQLPGAELTMHVLDSELCCLASGMF